MWLKMWLLAALLLCAPMHAQLWHRDRPASVPSMADVLSGRLDRPPEAFYQQRWQRLEPLLDQPGKAAAERLRDYDDAAITMLKLGRHGDAILVLDRKAALTREIRGDEPALGLEHTRRTLANKARILVRRWVEGGARDAADLTQARKLLAEAETEDRFSAEVRFAILEVEWLQSRPRWDSAGPMPSMLKLDEDSMRQGKVQGALSREGYGYALEGLCRRIAEDGWRNPDYFYALSLCLELEGRRDEAVFAWLRMEEIVLQGQPWLPAEGNAGPRAMTATNWHLRDVADLEARRTLFREQRRQADEWLNARNRHILEMLLHERHPDTDPVFWSDFRGVPTRAPAPQAEPATETKEEVGSAMVAGGLAALTVLLFAVAGIAVFFARRNPGGPSVDEL